MEKPYKIGSSSGEPGITTYFTASCFAPNFTKPILGFPVFIPLIEVFDFQVRYVEREVL